MYSQSSMVVGNATSTMPSGNQLTMSSREIAELTGKEHKNVIRDINNMIESLKKDGPNLSHEINQSVTYEHDARGYISNILLIKKYVECLLTGYSIPCSGSVETKKTVAQYNNVPVVKLSEK